MRRLYSSQRPAHLDIRLTAHRLEERLGRIEVRCPRGRVRRRETRELQVGAGLREGHPEPPRDLDRALQGRPRLPRGAGDPVRSPLELMVEGRAELEAERTSEE